MGDLGRRLSQRQARRQIGSVLLLRIDPRLISGSTARLEKLMTRAFRQRVPLPLPVIARGVRSLEPHLPFVVAAKHFPDAKPLDANRSSLLMQDLVLNRADPESSLWWQDRLDELSSEGVTTVKGRSFRDENAVRRHLNEYLLPMIDGLARNGWDDKLAESGPGSASIGPHGELLKAESVNHRFFLARSLGVREFPLLVRSVHHDWWDTNVLKGRRTASRSEAEQAFKVVAESHR